MTSAFSRPVKAVHIHAETQIFELAADEAARAALAARFGLVGIARLVGRFALHHERGGVIAAALSMQAEVTQACVVTLEPFAAAIAEEVELRFVPEQQSDADEDVLGPDSLDGPDEIPYADGMIDLGEALAEQLALALDPYPRKPGAELPEAVLDDEARPFAVLRAKFGKPG